MEKEKYYNGYYCIKCKFIPLIQIVPKTGNLFILTFCQCNKKYLQYQVFQKHFYKEKILINNINTGNLLLKNIDSNENDISLLYQKFNDIKIEINKVSKELLDNLNNYIKEKDPEKLNDKYKQYLMINNQISFLIENFHSSYKLIQDNSSIILNIINNSSFNKDFKKKNRNYLIKSSPDIYYKESVQFYQEEFIISKNSMGEQLKHNFLFHHLNSVNCFLEFDEKICVSNVKKNPNIYLYYISFIDKKPKVNVTNFKAHSENVNWIIKTQKKYLISCGDDGYLKIWPIINEKTNILDIKPLYSYTLDIQEIKKIEKMIYINENSFLAFSNKNIFLFEYTIDESDKSNTKINLVKVSNDLDLIDLIIIKREKKESIISGYNEKELFLININDLEIFKSVALQNTNHKNCLIQLNDSEIMIAQKNKTLLVLSIENLSLKLKYDNKCETDYLFKLKDETIIQSGPSGMHRIFLNNFQELPILFTPIKDTEFDYPYDVEEKTICLIELSNEYLIKCMPSGRINICQFIFI